MKTIARNPVELPAEDLIDAAELGKRLGVPRDTIYCWHSRGQLRGYRLPGGRCVRFRWSEIVATLERTGTD